MRGDRLRFMVMKDKAVPKKIVVYLLLNVVVLGLAGCSEARRNPCELLTVEDVESVDNTVSVSIWAGRDGERKKDEVCVFYTDEGDPRLMLFVWYDKDIDPQKLVAAGASGTHARIVDLPGVGLKAAASLGDDELKLIAVKSAQGVVGLRVKKPVSESSAEFKEIIQLAEKAAFRN